MSLRAGCTRNDVDARGRSVRPNPQHPKHGAAAFTALLVVRHRELLEVAVPLLTRANFEVDLVTSPDLAEGVSSCRAVHLAYACDQIAALLEQILLHCAYDLVVLGDDDLLSKVLDSPLSPELKQQILPVVSLAEAGHLYSKIGLSRQLAAAGIRTPRFETAASEAELFSASRRIGFPLLVKLDRSGGGAGVFCCRSPSDLAAALSKIQYPVLVQAFVEGEVIDLSGFYQAGRLVHFMYSRFEKTVGGAFGPSSLRTYYQLGTLEPAIFAELERLGRALGADGFVSVTAIQSASDGQRCFIEADMRPNVWVDYGRHVGNDAAAAIAGYFERGETLRCPQPLQAGYPESAVLPFPPRLRLLELLGNAHGCWRYMDGPSHVAVLSLRQVNEQMARAAAKLLKPWLPQPAWAVLKSGRRKIRRWLAAAVS